MTGKCGRAALLAIGVRQQSVYQRKTLLEKRRHRRASVRHLEDVRTTGRIEHVRPIEEARERLAVLAVADEAEAGGRGDITCYAAHAAASAAKREVMTSRRGDTLIIA